MVARGPAWSVWRIVGPTVEWSGVAVERLAKGKQGARQMSQPRTAGAAVTLALRCAALLCSALQGKGKATDGGRLGPSRSAQQGRLKEASDAGDGIGPSLAQQGSRGTRSGSSTEALRKIVAATASSSLPRCESTWSSDGSRRANGNSACRSGLPCSVDLTPSLVGRPNAIMAGQAEAHPRGGLSRGPYR